ncbi:reverse transcriptase, partial [Nephila pilipes]
MVTLATIGERFPERHLLHKYTDLNAGAGVYSIHFSLSRVVGKYCTNFDGKVDAVHTALTEIARRQEQNIKIFIDSQGPIRAISSVIPSKNSYAFECQLFIESMIKSGHNVALQWISSHCGIVGNEFSDSLAKAGSNLPQP